MKTIQINDDIYRVPQSWDEFTPKQLEYLARITQTEQPVEQLKLLMLLYCLKARVNHSPKLFGIKPDRIVGVQPTRYSVKIHRKIYRLSAEDILSLSELFIWLLKRVGGKEYKCVDEFIFGYYSDKRERFNKSVTYAVNPELTENPYPSLRIRLHRFIGPDDAMMDISFEQYMYLQTYLDAMSSDRTKLEYALACLWHTGKSFDINHIEHDARLLRRLPATKKMVMYWFILGTMQYLAASYPRVFSGGSGKIVGNVLDNQLRLLDSLAHHDMTKKDSVRKGLFIDALYSMDEQLRIQEEMNEKMK